MSREEEESEAALHGGKMKNALYDLWKKMKVKANEESAAERPLWRRWKRKISGVEI